VEPALYFDVIIEQAYLILLKRKSLPRAFALFLFQYLKGEIAMKRTAVIAAS
jgi:hypothetical protein